MKETHARSSPRSQAPEANANSSLAPAQATLNLPLICLTLQGALHPCTSDTPCTYFHLFTLLFLNCLFDLFSSFARRHIMLFSIFRRPNARLLFALFSFLGSAITLIFMFRDSFPTVETHLSKDALMEKAKRKAEAKALDDWQAYNSTIITDSAKHDLPPADPPFGDLVIAGQESTDLSWTAGMERSWTLLKYDANQPDNPDPRLRFPRRKGNEAVVYLSYLIDNYDSLPWCTLFVHGHAESWHQETDIATLIDTLDRKQLARYGYISLRCEWHPSCPAEVRPQNHDALIWGNDPFRSATEAAVGGNWKVLFPTDPAPDTMASPCCAQFAVTRETIRRRPKADYERFRDWLLGSLLDNDTSGRVLEKLWAYIFTGEAI